MNLWPTLILPICILAFCLLWYGLTKAMHEEGRRQGYDSWILNWMFGHPVLWLVAGVSIPMALLLGWGAP